MTEYLVVCKDGFNEVYEEYKDAEYRYDKSKNCIEIQELYNGKVINTLAKKEK